VILLFVIASSRLEVGDGAPLGAPERQDAVSVVATTVRPSPVTLRQARVRTHAWQLVLCCYALGALVVTWRLWGDPAGRAQAGDTGDVALFAWFMRYEATAVAHGHLPALTTAAMNAPRGVSLMWNTSLLLPGVLLTPVTLLAGPQVTLTVVLTLGFAGSAASLFWVLRRWGASLVAAALGGAIYGFSPALLNSGIGHYHLQFAALPPLIIDALLRLLSGRGNVVGAGIWLGLLAAAQLFTGEELLTDTALAALVLTAALAATHHRVVRDRARDVAFGMTISVAVLLVIGGHALWSQFYGPLRAHYVAQATHYTSYFSAHPSVFVTPPGDLLFHTSASAAAAASYPAHLTEYLAYLGWPLLAVLVIGAVRYWRDPRVRVCAVTFAALELLSLGSYRGLPVLSQMIPDRLAIPADGAAAALLAFALDRARSAPDRASIPRPGRLATAAAIVAVLPLIPLPYQVAQLTAVPVGWQAAFARLRLAPDARVLVVPIPAGRYTEAMRWQASTGEPGSLIGGYFLGPDQDGATRFSPGVAKADALALDPLWAGRPPDARRSLAQIRSDLGHWHPAAVLEVFRPHSRVQQTLTALLGRPSFRSGQVLVWRRR
jgi:hypothetical protein